MSIYCIVSSILLFELATHRWTGRASLIQLCLHCEVRLHPVGEFAAKARVDELSVLPSAQSRKCSGKRAPAANDRKVRTADLHPGRMLRDERMAGLVKLHRDDRPRTEWQDWAVREDGQACYISTASEIASASSSSTPR